MTMSEMMDFPGKPGEKPVSRMTLAWLKDVREIVEKDGCMTCAADEALGRLSEAGWRALEEDWKAHSVEQRIGVFLADLYDLHTDDKVLQARIVLIALEIVLNRVEDRGFSHPDGLH
jgi:hypothetical protein